MVGGRRCTCSPICLWSEPSCNLFQTCGPTPVRFVDQESRSAHVWLQVPNIHGLLQSPFWRLYHSGGTFQGPSRSAQEHRGRGHTNHIHGHSAQFVRGAQAALRLSDGRRSVTRRRRRGRSRLVSVSVWHSPPRCTALPRPLDDAPSQQSLSFLASS